MPPARIAERDGIDEGLVCVFSALEPCRTFSLRFTSGQPYVQTAKRKCLHLYYYFIDRDLGLLHVRVQTWFALQVQIYLNGHEWLARKLTARGIEHTKIDNVFIRVSDLPRAQRLSDRFAHLKWPQILNRYARQVVPQLDDVLHGCEYDWVAAQAEYSTDVMFNTADAAGRLAQDDATLFEILMDGTVSAPCAGSPPAPAESASSGMQQTKNVRR
jgi:hypothetical protein